MPRGLKSPEKRGIEGEIIGYFVNNLLNSTLGGCKMVSFSRAGTHKESRHGLSRNWCQATQYTDG